jgi:hypothetical protein
MYSLYDYMGLVSRIGIHPYQWIDFEIHERFKAEYYKVYFNDDENGCERVL